MKPTKLVILVAAWGAILAVSAHAAQAGNDPSEKTNAKSSASQPANSSTESQHSKTANSQSAGADQGQKEAFLGVAVESIPPAISHQLGESAGKGQGLLVADVADDSPAAKAGIKSFDVLLAVDDQKLFSPEQLIRLIRSHNSGQSITINLLRDGKKQDVKATLGEWTPPAQAEGPRNPGRRHAAKGRGPHAAHPGSVGSGRSGAEWDQFESLAVEQTAKDQFKIAVRYADESGKKVNREYDGTRQEIRKKVHDDKSLPTAERKHLLRSINMAENGEMPGMPGVRYVPGQGLIIDLDGFLEDQAGNNQHPTHSSGQSLQF